jgi:hypothetical protein
VKNKKSFKIGYYMITNFKIYGFLKMLKSNSKLWEQNLVVVTSQYSVGMTW